MFHRLPQTEIRRDREGRDNLDQPRRGDFSIEWPRSPLSQASVLGVLASLDAPGAKS